MLKNVIEHAPELARKHRGILDQQSECGCFFCLCTYPSSEIVDFADHGQTGLCPHCGIDAVLPGVTDQETLRAASERYFTVRTAQGVTIWRASR